ncbi:hypothetical protein [Salipiger sp. PrR003]|uniref:hypothetical protein n=1 Tax=Salipiger sp. PrR003 TaxID=2706776 RepID=UPI0013DAAA96|nr:hypothetical protein [Salipiger sp. PrR003]NDV51523.1 hypothetical protein [Salipiger sp. PrR003]
MDALSELNLDLAGRLFVTGAMPEEMKDRFMLKWLHSQVSEIAGTASDLMQREDLSQVTKRSLQTFAAALRAAVSLEMNLEQTKAVLISFETLATRTRLSDWPPRGSSEEDARSLFDTESITFVDLDIDEVIRLALEEGGEAGSLVEALASAYKRGETSSPLPSGAALIDVMPAFSELGAGGGPVLAGALAKAS